MKLKNDFSSTATTATTTTSFVDWNNKKRKKIILKTEDQKNQIDCQYKGPYVRYFIMFAFTVASFSAKKFVQIFFGNQFMCILTFACQVCCYF